MNKRFSGPAGQEENVKIILGTLEIPGYRALVYPSYRDIGYPGLSVHSTIVSLYLDGDLLKKASNALKNLGFSEE